MLPELDHEQSTTHRFPYPIPYSFFGKDFWFKPLYWYSITILMREIMCLIWGKKKTMKIMKMYLNNLDQ